MLPYCTALLFSLLLIIIYCGQINDDGDDDDDECIVESSRRKVYRRRRVGPTRINSIIIQFAHTVIVIPVCRSSIIAI